MEFYDEDARPRVLLQSKALQQPTRSDPEPLHLFHKPTLLLSLSLSILFLTLAFSYFTWDPDKSLLIWISLSFFLGPFAPLYLTAGDIRVGLGSPLEEPLKKIERSDDNTKKKSKKVAKFNRKVGEPNIESDISGLGQCVPVVETRNGTAATTGHGPSSINFEKKELIDLNEEADWPDEDDELMKKLMVRHPVGNPGRWEAIAGGLKRRHTVESVIKRSKEMGEKKVSDDVRNSCKDRKPVNRRIEEGNESNVGEIESTEGKGEKFGWSSGEDLALLNALKAFPKDVPMRWEKIAAAVPGKTKASCIKRVTDLKRDFRSSKAAGTVA